MQLSCPGQPPPDCDPGRFVWRLRRNGGWKRNPCRSLVSKQQEATRGAVCVLVGLTFDLCGELGRVFGLEQPKLLVQVANRHINVPGEQSCWRKTIGEEGSPQLCKSHP